MLGRTRWTPPGGAGNHCQTAWLEDPDKGAEALPERGV